MASRYRLHCQLPECVNFGMRLYQYQSFTASQDAVSYNFPFPIRSYFPLINCKESYVASFLSSLLMQRLPKLQLKVSQATDGDQLSTNVAKKGLFLQEESVAYLRVSHVSSLKTGTLPLFLVLEHLAFSNSLTKRSFDKLIHTHNKS